MSSGCRGPGTAYGVRLVLTASPRLATATGGLGSRAPWAARGVMSMTSPARRQPLGSRLGRRRGRRAGFRRWLSCGLLMSLRSGSRAVLGVPPVGRGPRTVRRTVSSRVVRSTFGGAGVIGVFLVAHARARLGRAGRRHVPERGDREDAQGDEQGGADDGDHVQPGGERFAGG